MLSPKQFAGLEQREGARLLHPLRRGTDNRAYLICAKIEFLHGAAR